MASAADDLKLRTHNRVLLPATAGPVGPELLTVSSANRRFDPYHRQDMDSLARTPLKSLTQRTVGARLRPPLLLLADPSQGQDYATA